MWWTGDGVKGDQEVSNKEVLDFSKVIKEEIVICQTIKDRLLGKNAHTKNPIKRLCIRIIYWLLYGPLFQIDYIMGWITANAIDPFKVKKISIDGISLCMNISSSQAYANINKLIHQANEKGLSFNKSNEIKENDNEIETRLWLKNNLEDGDIFMDVGANTGFYIIYANKVATLKRTIAIEAISLNTKEILQNIYINDHLDKDIITVHAGAGDENRLVEFNLSDIRTGYYDGRVEEMLPERFKHKNSYGKETVHLRTIDSIVKELGDEVPNVILMDIDGHEVPALKGMNEILNSSALRAIIVETRKWTFQEANDILISKGFRCINYDLEKEHLSFNFIYVR